MDLETARRTLDDLWQEADRRERDYKGGYPAADALKVRINNAAAGERELFERVIASWVGTKEDRKLYDTVVLISHFKMRSALPEMKRVRSKLRLLPWRRDDFELIDNAIRDLESEDE